MVVGPGVAIDAVGQRVSLLGLVGVDGQQVDVLEARQVVLQPEAVVGVEVEVVRLLGEAAGRLAVQVGADVVVELAVEPQRRAGARVGGRAVRRGRKPVEDRQVGGEGVVADDRPDVLLRVERGQERGPARRLARLVGGHHVPAHELAHGRDAGGQHQAPGAVALGHHRRLHLGLEHHPVHQGDARHRRAQPHHPRADHQVVGRAHVQVAVEVDDHRRAVAAAQVVGPRGGHRQVGGPLGDGEGHHVQRGRDEEAAVLGGGVAGVDGQQVRARGERRGAGHRRRRCFC